MPEETEQSPLRILIVDDELNIRKTLALGLESDGHLVVAVSNASDALDQVSQGSFDLAFVDLRLGTSLGLDLLPELRVHAPAMPIVIITAHASIDSVVETMKRGAADYLTKPFTPAQVRLVVQRVIRLRNLEQDYARLQDQVNESDAKFMLESSNADMRKAIAFARQIARSDTTALIRGESGTGKGVIARALHAWSNRALKPFATVSCPTLSPQLWKVNYLDMPGEPLPARFEIIPGASLRAKRARSFWMKSETCLASFSRSCCVLYRTGNTKEWVIRSRGMRMFDL